MVGRRRVRLLLGVLAFTVIVLIYTRKKQVETYRDYVTGKVVGGGSALRPKPAVQEIAAQRSESVSVRPEVLHGVSTSRAEFVPVTSSVGLKGMTSSMADELPSSTGKLVGTQTLTSGDDHSRPVGSDSISRAKEALQHLPLITYDESDLVYEVGEGRVDNEEPLRTTTSAIHWVKQTEHFPISTTIQLPTGSSRPFPRIQYAGKDAGKGDTERLAIIKEAAQRAWSGYRSAAFGMDEVKAMSGGHNNPFNGWGATLVDSLDTLWIMGMKDEFDDALERVRKIDFTTSTRSDIPLFETTIRYLGGLIAAYDVSGAQPRYRFLLDKAVELAEVLYSAFDTPNRMPQTFYCWKPAFASQPHRATNRVVMAELGSLSLEFTRLAQLTGQPKYYDAIARITDAFELWQDETRLPGMWPTMVDASGCEKRARMAYGSSPGSSNQQLVPGGSGQVMEAGKPVRGAKGANLVTSIGTDVDRGQQMAAQAKLDEQVATGEPGVGKIIGHGDPLTEGSLDGESRDQLANDLGSSKLKRQLDHSLINSLINSLTVSDRDARIADATKNATAHHSGADDPRRHTPSDPSNDPSNDPPICLPQGLSSTSKRAPESFTLGGQSDSTYEYLPKQHLLLGGLNPQYEKMYLAAAETIKKNLLFRPMTVGNEDILISGTVKVSVNATTGKLVNRLVPDAEHLTCFAGGMFALGGRIFDRPEDVEIGKRLTEGCVWAYGSTRTGIMPEVATVMMCPRDEMGEGEEEDLMKGCEWNDTAYWRELDPYEEGRMRVGKGAAVLPATTTTTSSSVAGSSVASTGSAVTASTAAGREPEMIDADKLLEGATRVVQKLASSDDESEELSVDLAHAKRQLDEAVASAESATPARPKPAPAPSPSRSPSGSTRAEDVPGPPVYTPKAPLSHAEYVQKKISDDRLPAGITHLRDRRYILRPEAIESVFYLYRITGDPHWRAVGWKMFVAIDTHTRALYGNAAIDDVTKEAPEMRDAMESFWVAETVKYFWLLFCDAGEWGLDEWVMNTEAHFFRRPAYDFVE